MINTLELKLILTNKIKDFVNESKDVALLFSGGTDSLSVLFTLLDLGIKPTLYTFRLNEYLSNDYLVAEKVAKHYNLKFKGLVIPYDKQQIKSDIFYLIKKFKTKRKTIIECSYPFIYLSKMITEEKILSGLSADSNYGTPASMSIKFNNDYQGFVKAKKKIFSDINSDGYFAIKTLIETDSKKFFTPYRDPQIVNFFMKHTWKELNKPMQKWFIVKIWQDRFNELRCYRKNSNLQVESKIRERMKSILNSNESIIKFYNQVYNNVI